MSQAAEKTARQAKENPEYWIDFWSHHARLYYDAWHKLKYGIGEGPECLCRNCRAPWKLWEE